jgi:hypothetical protein
MRQTGGSLSDMPEAREASGKDLEGLIEIHLGGMRRARDLIAALRPHTNRSLFLFTT